MTDTGQIPDEGLPENAGGQQPEGQPGVPASGAHTFAGPAGGVGDVQDVQNLQEAQGVQNIQHAAQAASAHPPQNHHDVQGPHIAHVPHDASSHHEPHEEEDLLLMPSAQGAWNEQPAPGPGQPMPQTQPHPQTQPQPEGSYEHEYDPHGQPHPAAAQQPPQEGGLPPEAPYGPEGAPAPGEAYAVNGYAEHGHPLGDGAQDAAYVQNGQGAAQPPAQDTQPAQPEQPQPDAAAGAASQSAAAAPEQHETDGRDSGSIDVSSVRNPQQPQPHAAPASPQSAAPGNGNGGGNASGNGPRRPLHLGPPVPEQSGTVRPLSERAAAQPAPAAPQAAPVQGAPVQNAPAGPAPGAAPQQATPAVMHSQTAEPAAPEQQPAQAEPPAQQPEPQPQPQHQAEEQPHPEPQPGAQPQPQSEAPQPEAEQQAPVPAVEEPLPGPQLGQLPPDAWTAQPAPATAEPGLPAEQPVPGEQPLPAEQAAPVEQSTAAEQPAAEPTTGGPIEVSASGEAVPQQAPASAPESAVSDTVPGPRQEAQPGALPTVPAQGGEAQPQSVAPPINENPEQQDGPAIPEQATTAPDSPGTSSEAQPDQEPEPMPTPEAAAPQPAPEAQPGNTAEAAAPVNAPADSATMELGSVAEATEPAPPAQAANGEADADAPTATTDSQSAAAEDESVAAEATTGEATGEPEAAAEAEAEAQADTEVEAHPGTAADSEAAAETETEAKAEGEAEAEADSATAADSEAAAGNDAAAATEAAADPGTAPGTEAETEPPTGDAAASEPGTASDTEAPTEGEQPTPAEGEATAPAEGEAPAPADTPAEEGAEHGAEQGGQHGAEDVADAPVGDPAPGYAEAEREAVHRLMRERRDIRNGFRPDPIPHDVLLRVLEAAHTAPSVGHSQPWDFVVIRSEETRRTMHELAERQRLAYAKSLPKGRAKQFKEMKIEAILDTPVNIVVTADPTRGGRHTLGRHTQPQMAPYSSALAVENLWLAARAEGLGVGWVSFFDERELVRTLELPEHLEIVAYLCVGYVDEFPDEPELMQAGWSKRRPLSWVVHEESYGRRALPGAEPAGMLAETLGAIRPLDAKALGEAWERQKRMTKPAGALGMLEIISAQLCGLSRKCPPPVPEPAAVAIFAGDHGVHAQGVTPWPQEVTAQMVANFLGGGAVCNAFANQVGAEVCVIDVGVAAELPATPGLLPRKVRAGTADMTAGPALSREDVERALEVGIETARDLVAAGNKALLTGEMGIANTTASAALIAACTGADPAEVTGRGTGINDETHARKVEVVRRALELHQPDPADPLGMLSAFGGLEHAAMVGLILGGASLRTPVILDGVSAGAAALVARAVAPEALAACIAGHRSAEPGHVAALTKLGLRPLVDLDLRLGEGTGALLALPMVQSAARAMHEVATFDAAGVTEKG
ncbi:nicotinate-nucleotide--dimethylbenzimidazole phosphoribosyltransferase [Streptomyces oryzae]|uniref:Nicotinate-nucleotide--dimethylbenzimidazole phosphoribosyltransferase n=1 Tax=Streptomyces oryzae TaxID=1434886 RepID=A0ABS3X5X1_9ACTN|nr:nicotinate-nucleotide--dimethylbenzimidazole phosphoribosyltransferase [Streptomyces oryzae]MBO8190743.1 nicotinate-nucleotide--dimethylbenzimidazole phosphoribosyltransferase [Streptomyces oryzae]